MQNRMISLEFLTLAAIAALGGIVRQILWPDHRVGLLGFLAAALVGIFCGLMFASAARAFGWPPDVILIACGTGSVMGFSMLRGIISWIEERKGTGDTFLFQGNPSVQIGDDNKHFDNVEAKNLQTGDNAQVHED